MRSGAADERTRTGERLRELRRARGISLRALARLLEVSPSTLSAVENGHAGVSAARLARIAELLGAPMTALPAGDVPATGPPRARRPPDRGPRPGAVEWRRYDPLDLGVPLAAALDAFVEVGYHGATIRDIARRADLSVPGLYHHVSSKQEMLVTIHELTMNDLLARAEAARAESRDPVSRFCLLVENLVLFHTHRRELGFVGSSEMRGLAPAAHERIVAARRRVQRMVDIEVDAAARAGLFATATPREASRAVVTMCTAVSRWFQDGGPASAEEIAVQYVGFALDLVGCAPAQARPVTPAPTRPVGGTVGAVSGRAASGPVGRLTGGRPRS